MLPHVKFDKFQSGVIKRMEKMLTTSSRNDCVCSKFVEEDGKTFMMMTTGEVSDVSEAADENVEEIDDSEDQDDLSEEESEEEFVTRSQVRFCTKLKK